VNTLIRWSTKLAGTALAAFAFLATSSGSAVAVAEVDPVGVSFTLEGCRNDGTVALPNGSGKFICPDAAYTTGNLGKGWSELDLVPHRITAQAGNSAPTSQTYTIAIAADNCDGDTGTSYNCADGSHRTPGYDVMSIPVRNGALSNASCPMTVEDPAEARTKVGGTAVSIARKLTITQARNTTCVYDYYERLALGSHLFPGSSLHSDLLNKDFGTSGIGAKDVSIPVKEIAPQELTKDMAASEGADNQWSVTKVPTPASVSFGDVCLADAPQPQPVSIKVTWTMNQTAGGINVVTHVYATNPATRTITVSVVDRIYAGSDQTVLLHTSDPAVVDVPANTTSLVLTHTKAFDAGTAGLAVDSFMNDVASASYTDAVTGVEVPGTTTAKAQAKVTAGSTSNATADVSDEESITGTGLKFKVTDPTTGYTGSPAYVADTPTVGPVDWATTGLQLSGSVTFSKTVYLDVKRITTGKLSDTATISSGDTVLDTASLDVGISSSASTKLTISKTVPDILGAGEKFEVKFHIVGTTPAVPGDDSTIYSNDKTLTFLPGDTTKSVDITSLAPDTYVVTESSNTWFPSDFPTHPSEDGLLAAVGVDTQSVDLTADADGVVANCSGTASFTNALAQGFAHAKVQKITYPALDSSDPDYNWNFTLKLPDGTTTLSTASASAGQGFVLFGAAPGVDLAVEGTYTVIETTKTGWDLNSASPNDGVHTKVCSFTVNYPQNEGQTFGCTFTNTKRGHAKVIKTASGVALTGNQAFTFELLQGATTSADGTVLETLVANATNAGTITFATALLPASTYQLCEIVMPGWNTNLGLLGTLFVPNSIIPPSLPNPNVNNMTVCVNFAVNPGETKTFNIDNSPPPGGRALTIGFWKNWASCTTSSTSKKPTLDATLYGYLPSGIKVGNVLSVVNGKLGLYGQNALSTADCPHAVALLNKSTFSGTKMASDPLFNLAAQLVGAELNQAAGAGVCVKVVNTINYANTLLTKYKFVGTSYTGKVSSADANLANTYATELDNFNNDRPIACQ